MNDPLKEFVERNREEFDELEAPQFNLDLLKQRMAAQEVDVQPQPRYQMPYKWLVAAAAIVLMMGSILMFNRSSTDRPAVKNAGNVKTNTIVQPAAIVPVEKNTAVQQVALQKSVKQRGGVRTALQAQPNVNLIDQGLADSSSASNRLAVILAIDEQGYISEHMINRLAKTLERDGNSNVRLAALNVMEKYKDDAHVSGLLIQSLNNQTDPLVQLELVRILGDGNNAKVEQKLYALVNDPNTFDAVKDEAYMALMKENKQ